MPVADDHRERRRENERIFFFQRMYMFSTVQNLKYEIPFVFGIINICFFFFFFFFFVSISQGFANVSIRCEFFAPISILSANKRNTFFGVYSVYPIVAFITNYFLIKYLFETRCLSTFYTR